MKFPHNLSTCELHLDITLRLWKSRSSVPSNRSQNIVVSLLLWGGRRIGIFYVQPFAPW